MTTEFARKDYAHSEGQIAKAIEDQTAKLPSDTFLWMAVGSIAVSATMHIMGNKHVSLFVGQWAPTFLLLGLYNKLVKQLGSDRTENAVAPIENAV
jgi:cytosine/uracil/thiamine/allantoin permease